MQTLTLSGNWIDLPSLRALLEKFPTLEILDLDHTGIVNVPNGLFHVRLSKYVMNPSLGLQQAKS